MSGMKKKNVVSIRPEGCSTTGTAELRVSNLKAAYKENSILHDINLSLVQGEFVCLCGPNGAGKTTLLSVMAGVPDVKLKVSGEVNVVSIRPAGYSTTSTADPVVECDAERRVSKPQEPPVDLKTLPRSAAARLLAYMQQNEYSEWDFNVRDYVLQGRYAHAQGLRRGQTLGRRKLSDFFRFFGPANYTAADYAVVDGVLAELNLSQFATRTIHSLSGGEFQKIRLARALAQTPKFLLLDEPAANLDYVFEPQLMQLLRDTTHNKKLGVLAAVHDINLAARFADKIILLPPASAAPSAQSTGNSKKSVLFGSPSDIINEDNLKYTFGVDFECKEIKSYQSLL